MFGKLLSNFMTGASSSRNQRRSASKSLPRRLQLESLEGRLNPSTLTVTSNADHGLGSLRDTISDAASGDTIVFASSVHSIVLTTGELAIAKSLDIEGPGANKLTVSGGNVSRVFEIDAGTVTLAKLTVAHGQSNGQLPSSIVGVYTGTGSGAGGGGGILNMAGATLTLKSDTFTANQAVGAVGFTVLGGALLNLGTANVVTCQFTNNESVGGGALDAIGGSAGGAIDNFGNPAGGATLTVVGSTFVNNESAAAGGGYYFGLGGAIESDGGLNGYDPTLTEPSTATITNSSFLGNEVTGGPNALGNGGAMNCEAATTTLIGCTISGNRNIGGGGGDGITTGDSEAVGGGLSNGFGTLTVTGCSITDNQAIGGANTTSSTTDPFAGGGFGGGIENNFNGILHISNTLLSGNLAQGGATTSGPGADAFGGGISNSPGATMVMTNCVVSNNQAIGGHGGPGVNSALGSLAGGFAFGGGVDTSRGSTATISGSLILDNQAVGGVGGNGNSGGNGYGGGLSVGFGDLIGFGPDGAQLTLINTLVADNLALGGKGGTGANGGDGLGGGIYVSPSCSATLTSSLVIFNAAVGGEEGKGKGGTDGDGIGGGIYDTGTLSVDPSTFIAFNFASTSNDNIYP